MSNFQNRVFDKDENAADIIETCAASVRGYVRACLCEPVRQASPDTRARLLRWDDFEPGFI